VTDIASASTPSTGRIERSIWSTGTRRPHPYSRRKCADLAAVYADESRFAAASTWPATDSAWGSTSTRGAAAAAGGGAPRERVSALAAIANSWQAAFGDPACFRPICRRWLRRCHKRGQTKPTPLLLRYEAGGYNCLHQDLYGDVVFPSRSRCFLSRRAWTTRAATSCWSTAPRAQSRGEANATEQGEIVIFTTPPAGEGTRGVYARGDAPRREPHHQGACATRSASIFHDAK